MSELRNIVRSIIAPLKELVNKGNEIGMITKTILFSRIKNGGIKLDAFNNIIDNAHAVYKLRKRAGAHR